MPTGAIAMSKANDELAAFAKSREDEKTFFERAGATFKKLSDWPAYLLFIATAKAIEILPGKLCYPAAAATARLFARIDFPLKRRAVRNLLHAGVAKNAAEASRVADGVFVSFFKLAIDIFKSRERLKAEKLDEILSLSGPEESKRRFFTNDGSKAEPIILVCAHFGNWEVAGQAYSLRSGIPLTSIMRPFDNKLVGDYIVSRRAGGTHFVCDKKGGVKELLKALRRGESISILPDQHASRKDGGIETTFFGHPVRTHASPAQLHLKTGVPILILMCKRVSDDFKFEFKLSAPIEVAPSENHEADILAITQRMNDEIEAIVRDCPEQWLWVHRRWLDLDRRTSQSAKA